MAVGAQQCDAGAREDAANSAGPTGHGQQHRAEAADRAAEESGEALHQQGPRG